VAASFQVRTVAGLTFPLPTPLLSNRALVISVSILDWELLVSFWQLVTNASTGTIKDSHLTGKKLTRDFMIRNFKMKYDYLL
jgi:hypothetical protein